MVGMGLRGISKGAAKLAGNGLLHSLLQPRVRYKSRGTKFRNPPLSQFWPPALGPYHNSKFGYTVYPPYKRWGSVAELTCPLKGSTPYVGLRFPHKTYNPLPTKDVT
jgi:hypothetical protein